VQKLNPVQNPIVLIAHSLGGLVVKTAFNLAKQNPRYQELSRRFHALVFLATPHRGADDATMLSNILRASTANASRRYTADLAPNSSNVEHINENFRHHYHGARIWSFYETLPTPSTSLSSNELLVEKRSSVLGFAEETQVPLTTNHIDICRFSSSSDPSFQLIRDALAGIASGIVEDLLNPETVAQQMRLLANYLGATDVEEEELESLESLQVEGSCKWFLQTTSFRDWRDTESAEHQTPGDLSSRLQKLATNGGRLSTQRAPPRIFWLTGAPGCGKSVIVSAVVRHLQEEDRQCYFYFLKHTDKSKQNLSGLLISLAWQMARRDVALRRSLLRMRLEDELTAESNDFRAIWKQLFTQRILRTHFQQRQYWIIDALDEAHGGHELISLLKGVPENLPISIFVTSRKDLTLEKHMQRAPMLQVVTKRIEPRDTLADIRLYLEDNVEDLPVSDPADVEDLIEKLTLKSQGSFLWTRLMLQKLENTWAQGDIDEAIDSIPEGLQDMYLQILEDMEENNASNKELAKSILRWAVCGGRPLTKVELQEAIRLDTGQKVHKLGKMLERLCGQLVSIDDQDRLQMVHDTARDFLLDPTLNSEFAINKAETHEQLADICLKYLLEDTKTPATRRPFPTINDSTVPAFRSYASLYFSEHVFKSPPADPQTARSRLEVFLEHSILNWIEYIITETKDLSRLTQAAKKS
jgi:CheY-like chemotaxis protein